MRPNQKKKLPRFMPKPEAPTSFHSSEELIAFLTEVAEWKKWRTAIDRGQDPANGKFTGQFILWAMKELKRLLKEESANEVD